MNTYNLYGWYSADQFPNRVAPTAPANTSLTEVEGEQRANWTGYEWVELPYKAPVIDVPTAPVPASVTRGQFKLALLQMDLLDDVEAAIALADRATQINYAERLDFERNHPLVITMATALGKTEADVDALFILAATL